MFDKTISEFVEQQFPAIYRESGQDVVAFLEAYYEYLQQASSGVGALRNLFEYGDIDTTLEEFVQFFSEKYLNGLPSVSSTDRRFLVKHIKDIYSARGSEKAVTLLFRLLFNEDAEIYRPDRDVFRASDSQWKQPFYIELSYNPINETFVGKMVTGSTSGSTAFVEAIVRKRVAGKIIDIAYITNISGNFLSGERIQIEGSNHDDFPYMIGSLSSIDITLGGGNYQVGNILTVLSPSGKQGKVRVTAVENSTGRVSFEIIDGGFGYTLTRNGMTLNDFRSEIMISDAVLNVDNTNLEFDMYEDVEQARAELNLLSAYSISEAGFTPGDVLVGKNADGDPIATGTIYELNSIDSSGNVSETPQSNVKTSVFVETGSFEEQTLLTLSSVSGIRIGDLIREGSHTELDMTMGVGTFPNGTWINQVQSETIDGDLVVTDVCTGRIASSSGTKYQVNPSFGTFRTGIPVTAGSNTATINIITPVSTGADGVVSAVNSGPKTVVVRDVNGVFNSPGYAKQKHQSTPASISDVEDVSVTDVHLQSNVLCTGVVLSRQNFINRGIVVGQNTTAVGIYGNTTAFKNLPIQPEQLLSSANDMNSASWTKNNIVVNATQNEGINRLVPNSLTENSFLTQQLSFVNGTSYRFFCSVSSISGSNFVMRLPAAFRADNSSAGITLRVDVSTGQYQMTGPSGAIEIVEVTPNILAGYDVVVVAQAQRNALNDVLYGLAVGGIGGTVSPANDVTIRSLIVHEKTVLFYGTIRTDRVSNNIVKAIEAIGTGHGASFEITSLENTETISTNTDIIGGNNITGYIQYPSIRIDGAWSGVGLVQGVTVTTPGTGYSNGQAVSFSGGGFDGSEPLVQAAGTITTDGSGGIVNVNVTAPGAGFFETPNITLPGPGTGGSVQADMMFGYGFPASPYAGLNSLIADALTIETMTIGTISGIGRINPGVNYNKAPFLAVRNKWISGFDRKELELTLTSVNGMFAIGELVQQVIPDPDNPGLFGFAKGIVKETGLNQIIVKRVSFAFSLTPDVQLTGMTSGSTATVASVREVLNSKPIGDNAVISSNVVTANGTISKIEVINSGYGYKDGEEVSLVSDTNITSAGGIGRLVIHGRGEGYWQTKTSHPSHDKYLQDSDFYQTHSYQIRTPIVMDRYKSILEKVMHIAGTKLFGEVLIQSVNNMIAEHLYTNVSVDESDDFEYPFHLDFVTNEYIYETI